jgi:hypothetical protein
MKSIGKLGMWLAGLMLVFRIVVLLGGISGVPVPAAPLAYVLFLVSLLLYVRGGRQQK